MEYQSLAEQHTPVSQLAVLADISVYIDFGFLTNREVNLTKRYFFEPLVHCWDEGNCDFAVLELKENSYGGTMPDPLINFSDPTPNGTFYLMEHTTSEMKRFSEVMGIIDLNREENQKNLADGRKWSKDLIKDTHHAGIDGYIGAENGHRVIFKCDLENGAAGSPGIVVLADFRVVVVTMLVCCYPSWFYDPDVSVFLKNKCTYNHRFEQGIKMSSIYNFMDRRQNLSAVKDAIFGKKDDTILMATLPTEILCMDNQSIQLYKKALSEGKVSIHSIRVMVVGDYGVGKTTLTHRLLEEDVDLSTRDSTNGIDVHVRRCRVSLADQSWTVLKKGEKVDTVFKKLAKVLRKSSNEDESFVEEAGLDDANVNCNNNSTSGVETNTELKEVAPSQVQAAASDGEMSVDTNDSVVEGDVAVTLKDLKELISNTDASLDSDYADLSIWDFAGKPVFYTTHQMFLSSRAVYLLVTDISKHVNDIVEDDECYFDSKVAESYEISGFVNFWLNSIHGCCPSDKETDVPPVILVGTHADKLNKSTKEQQENKYFEAVRNIFNVKASAQHVVEADFSIDNAINDPNLDELKNKIYEVASKLKNWGETIPVNWLTLEHALGKHANKGLKIITREKLQDVNNAMPVPIPTEYLNLFLQFQHESANVLYFDDPGLSGSVVLDPQWLVDCLKSLITAKQFCSKRSAIWDQWKELNRDGILRPCLIEAVWQQDKNQSFWDHHDHLILLMEKLNIFVPCHSGSDTVHHLVPCMLKKPPTVVYNKSDCVSTSVLCIKTADGFLPIGIFQRLIAACITRWQISKQDQTNLIYCGYGCFDLDEFNRMKLYFRDCVIQLWVCNYSMKSPATNVCMEVKNFILQALQGINKCFKDLKLWIKCNKTDDMDNINALLSVEKLQKQQYKDNEVICHKHADSHRVTCYQLLCCWYQEPLEEVLNDQNLSNNATHDDQDPLEKVPTDIQVSHIATYIGKEYFQLGLLLGVYTYEMEYFNLEFKKDVDRTIAILFSWRKRNGSKATFRELKEAMMNVHIDTTQPLECMKLLRCRDDPLEEIPTDKQVFHIARYIGKEYQELGLQLGVLQCEIDQFQLDFQFVVKQTMEILFSWRKHNGSRATFRVLKQAMIDVNIDTTKPLECMK